MLPRFTIPQDPDRSRSGTTQVTLSLVCSRWREIALNTTALWGDVVVIYDAGRERARGPTASFQFGLTAPESLSISVYEALESQIAAISQTSFHVTKLDLASFHSFLLVPILALQLSFYEPAWWMSRTTDVFPRLPEMPSLKELHLCSYPGEFADLTNIYLIPWDQLRVFTLSDNHWSSWMLFNIL
ncbi:hypothetical protein JOM56_005060 [Amanita muscaria]